jgi:hypothetical protein
LGGSTKNTDRVEKAIQEPGIELCTTVKLYDALLEYLFDVRQKFDYFEKMAKDLGKKMVSKTVQTESKRSFNVVPEESVPDLCAKNKIQILFSITLSMFWSWKLQDGELQTVHYMKTSVFLLINP